MGRRISDAALRAVELVRQGATYAQAGRAVGITSAGAAAAARRNGVVAVKKEKPGPKPGPANPDRSERIATMYRQGLTLETIGSEFQITRERVRQLLKAQGITRTDGGQHKQKLAKVEARRARLDLISIKRFGIDNETRKARRADGTLLAFEHQRQSAGQRGIAWNLTFVQWYDLWLTSGKLDCRGRGVGKYVMSRIQDDGPYAIGNAHIQLATDNSREAVKRWLGVTKKHVGVHCLFPGTARPYIVKVQQKQVGGRSFATAEEAAAFRVEYIREAGLTLRPDGVVKAKPRQSVLSSFVGADPVASFVHEANFFPPQ